MVLLSEDQGKLMLYKGRWNGVSPNFQTKPRLKSKSNDDGLSEHFESAAHLLSFSPPVIIFGVV
jgi:hypothetical protein